MIFFGEQNCIEWFGNKTHGYGRYGQKRVHRLLAEFLSGEKLSLKDFVCHRCNNRACFNPNHLYIGNAKTNADDKEAAGTSRSNKILSHCKTVLAERKKKPIIDRFGNIYSSVNEASKKTGYSRRNISNNLNGWSKAVGHGSNAFKYYSTCDENRT